MEKRIPKVIHYCWFGKGKKSRLIKKCIKSWREKCSDYEIKEWNEENFDIDKFDYVREAYENKRWAFVTDFARLWIIYNYGGIYLDTDVELLTNFENLLSYDSFFALEISGYIATGLGFGAKKNNKIVKKMLDDYENVHFVKEDNTFDLMPCPIRNTNSIKKIYEKLNKKELTNIENNAFLSADFFCPFNPQTGEMKKTNNTVGIHWYSATWRDKKVNLRGKILRPIKRIIGKENFEKLKKIIKWRIIK